MKEGAVSLTIERIETILNDHKSKSKQKYIEVHLENLECKGAKMKLRLHVSYDGKTFGEIVSDCLSIEEVGQIQEATDRFCTENKMFKY